MFFGGASLLYQIRLDPKTYKPNNESVRLMDGTEH